MLGCYSASTEYVTEDALLTRQYSESTGCGGQMSLIGCVSLEELLNLSVMQFPQL